MKALLAIAVLLGAAEAYVVPLGRAAAHPRAPAAAMNLFGGSWPWEQQKCDKEIDEPGKFKPHSELQPGCSPLGVVCAGFCDDGLEALAATIESILTDAEGQATAHVPIAVLAKGDLRLRLRDVLGQLNERDSVLPDQPSTPKVPLVLLSGFSTVATSATVRAVRALGLTGGQSGEERPMFAVAVPNALDKPLSVLIDEISGDHLANRQAAPDA